MSGETLDSLDPMPIVLSLIKTLHDSSTPDDTQITAEATKLKTMMRQARARLSEVQYQELSLRDQEEIIDALRDRVERKRKLLDQLDGARHIKMEEVLDVST